MHQNFIRAAAAAAVAATFSSAAVAGGFQLTEQSALGLGRAYAGMGVDGTDVSGLYYNPATMTLHTGTQAHSASSASASTSTTTARKATPSMTKTAASTPKPSRTSSFRTRSMT